MLGKKITFIGAGKMAGAMVGALIKAGYSPTAICASAPSCVQLEALQRDFGIRTSQDNKAAAADAEILVLAVKPQILFEVLRELKPTIAAHLPLVISIAAGIPEAAIVDSLIADVAVIRVMPNTPVLIGHGMSVLYAKQTIPITLKQQAEAIFQAVGATLWVEDEAQFNAITALSGSGPAYFFILMEALQQAGSELGLSQAVVNALIVQTAIGSAHLARASEEPFAKLRQQVTSAGGGTERALQVLANGQFSELVVQAVTAAKLQYDKLQQTE